MRNVVGERKARTLTAQATRRSSGLTNIAAQQRMASDCNRRQPSCTLRSSSTSERRMDACPSSRRRSPAACPSPPGSPSRISFGRRGSSTATRSPRRSATPSASRVLDQEQAGIDIVTDGEQTRRHFVTTFIEGLDGVDFEHKRTVRIRNRYDADVPVVVGPGRAPPSDLRRRRALPARADRRGASSTRCPAR